MTAKSPRMIVSRATLVLFCSLSILSNLGWPGLTNAFHDGGGRETVPGDTLPKIHMQTVQDYEIELPADEGITVILFWATWSPRSKLALGLWEKFSDDYADQPLTIITVNAESDELSSRNLQIINEYIAENIQQLPVVMDEGLKLFNTFAVKALPTVFFMNSSGMLLHRYPSFPTSATLDLQDELEITLGLRARQTEEEKASRGKLDYQPANNALLYYNLGVQLYKKGLREKALQRFAIALLKDPEYEDPLRTLEGIFFQEERTPETEASLEAFLLKSGLDVQLERIGEGDPILIEAPKKLNAMERMRQLMEKNAPAPGSSR